MTEEEFNEMERAEAQKHDDKVKELEAVTEKNSVVEEAYRKGYKAGQKDTFTTYDKEVTEMNNDYSYRLKKLEEENEELKWEQKQILEDNDNYQKENEELKAQIEKMKEDVRTEISRHSNLTENTLFYLLNKWS